MTTEKRMKFYNDMSTEERSIRYFIEELKFKIKCNKNFLTYSSYKHNTLSNFNIAESKLVIKALKKQIIQKPYFDDEPNHFSWRCPSCHYQVCEFGAKLNVFHCPNCGQRLC